MQLREEDEYSLYITTDLLTLGCLDVPVAEVCPCLRYADIWVNLFYPSMEIDSSAGVLEVVTSVVNVDAVVLVGQVSLKLMSGISVDSKLMVHLL